MLNVNSMFLMFSDHPRILFDERRHVKPESGLFKKSFGGGKMCELLKFLSGHFRLTVTMIDRLDGCTLKGRGPSANQTYFSAKRTTNYRHKCT